MRIGLEFVTLVILDFKLPIALITKKQRRLRFSDKFRDGFRPSSYNQQVRESAAPKLRIRPLRASIVISLKTLKQSRTARTIGRFQ